MKIFEDDFLLGAATAAHQVEGNNIHSDCWIMEQMEYSSFSEPSLDACDHYHRYKEDIRLLKDAGLNAYRFSIEWARIEPECGRFEEAELDHYEEVADFCLQCGIEPVITLHHFSSPAWLMGKGGWESEDVIGYFSRYCGYVTERLKDKVHYICTINEANMGIQIAELSKKYMEQLMSQASSGNAEGSLQLGFNLEDMLANQKKAAEENRKAFGVENPQSFLGERTAKGDEIICRAHMAAREKIREINPLIKTGLTLSLFDIQVLPGGEEKADEKWQLDFGHYLPYIKDDDFIGIQNYTRCVMGADGEQQPEKGAKLTDSGYEFYPFALANVIRKVAASFKGELLVTENGVATGNDQERITYIEEAAKGVADCIKEGIPVKAYLYWSLLDNFEWQKGYGIRFGLVGVDRGNGHRRMPKNSLTFLGGLRRA